MSDGSRLQRRFYVTDKIQTVVDFVDSKRSPADLAIEYDLVSNFPRKTFSGIACMPRIA
jgi:hypothetical protein